MIELERHIEILLLDNDCVIVPDLGGFMAHHVDARYDEQDNMFVPPIRTLGFNPQLKMNDSLLVQSYIEAYDLSYPEALRRLEEEVTELRAHLETDGEYMLNGIGRLHLNEEGNLEFEPCEAGILTPELYGLSAFPMTPLEDRHQASQAVSEAAAIPDERPITIKMSWLRNAVAVAAAVVAFLMIGTPVSNSDKVGDVQQSAFIRSVMPSGETASARHHRPSPSPADIPSPTAAEDTRAAAVAEPVAPVAPVADATSGFCIVMASQVTERNAQTFVDQIREKGYGEARIVVSGNNKIRRVVYGSYASNAEASEALKQLRSESRLFRETWIMELR